MWILWYVDSLMKCFFMPMDYYCPNIVFLIWQPVLCWYAYSYSYMRLYTPVRKETIMPYFFISYLILSAIFTKISTQASILSAYSFIVHLSLLYSYLLPFTLFRISVTHSLYRTAILFHGQYHLPSLDPIHSLSWLFLHTLCICH